MARHGKAKARAKWAAMAPTKSSPHRFTMQQEARNTETHNRLWSNNNLRHKAVNFVSAGELQRSETENAVREDRGDHGQTETVSEVVEPETQGPPEPPEDTHESAFFLDSTGQTDIHTGLPNPTLRTESSVSDSSEDEVVFTGRNVKPVVIETGKDELQGILHTVNAEQTRIPVAPEMNQSTHTITAANPLQGHAISHKQRNQKKLIDDKVDPLADYIANIDQDYYEEEEGHSHTQLEPDGGIEVGQASAEPGSSASSSTESEDADDAQVQSSIDVLSRMYLDTKPDAAGSGDEVAELDTSDEFDLDFDGEGDLDSELLEELAIKYSTQRKKGAPIGKQSILSASAFADALESDPYYGFDIMDFDRPSLQKKGKGKKPPALDPMLSDSDLEFHLQEVWQSDRKKKKAKKTEREELRSQGLLGRHPGDPNLKVKYSKGMNLEELISEMRTFLLSSKTSLSLPPMTKQRRKTIHELANTLNLKSQSRGHGPARFPMLLKTSRTPGYTRKTISQFDHLLSGRKLNRRLFQSWGPDGSKPIKVKRGAVGGAVSYMDGDVVGASAPEIGVENRGRAMLEKMGWSSGTALGASNNKGILQPVAHVVKNSRAGLG